MAQNLFDPIPTRHSLLNRLKDWRDQTSWQDFFDTYWRLIYNVAAKAGLTDTEAEEVVQETVITVAKKISEFKADPARGSFSAWLITRHVGALPISSESGRKRCRSVAFRRQQRQAGRLPYARATPDDRGNQSRS